MIIIPDPDVVFLQNKDLGSVGSLYLFYPISQYTSSVTGIPNEASRALETPIDEDVQ